MTDPYQLLGVDYRADEKEIKNAYKKMVKKNHPDRFQDPKEIERANEKMTEINAAFDQIMEDRRLGVSPAKYRTYNAAERQKREREKKASQFRRYSEEDYARYQERTSQETVYGADYESIQSAIDSGDLITADEKLTAIPEGAHLAKWHYLKGMVYVKRGWLNEAYHSVRTATQMDPGNPEYAETFQQMNRARSGYMTGGSFDVADKKGGKSAKASGAVCPFTFKL